MADDDSPGPVTELDIFKDPIGGRVDHRNVVRETVGRINFLTARRDGQPPDALPHRNRSQHLVALRIEHHDGVAPARGDVDTSAVAQFDRAYAKQRVKDHQEAVSLYQRQSTRGSMADLKSFASATLPALQEHLSMARSMSGGSGGGSMNHNGNMNSGGMGNTNGNSNR